MQVLIMRHLTIIAKLVISFMMSLQGMSLGGFCESRKSWTGEVGVLTERVIQRQHVWALLGELSLCWSYV